MLRQAENEALTRVGAGTPAGELLRRYWHPVAMAGELSEEKPIKAVKILGENLVVFRMPPGPNESQPRYGLVAEQCRHRLASLAYGRVDNEGIRCPYHGWKYGPSGRCLEQPAEPADSKYKDEIRQPAYPLQKLAGLLFAYLGPEPAPLLPRWDVLAWEDGKRWVVIESVIDCNWLQAMENSVDPSHLYWLHGNTGHLGGHMAQYQEEREFIRFEYGINKRRITPGKNSADSPMIDEHPLVFPLTLRHVSNEVRGERKKEQRTFRHNVQIRVPIDDTHTQVYRVNFVPSVNERSPADRDPPYEYRPLKSATGEYYMDIVSAQDSMAWETQGAIMDRTQEHLGASDRGIVMLRKLLKEQIEIVRNGGDPMGVLRDPNKNTIIEFDVINERIGLYRAKKQSDEVTTEAS
ncbi:MAG: aromatic ring-hydroxylating dioxygenase subunit alpha [Burkholderiales bacterium]|nr:aromatic ring-hydroxylating dioxygenase subunit alpha [Burkholderiales bacterium]